ncbi:MAG: MFS transporter, partial [Eubacterium sp.]|nr:MFS transporter [Eubacterium sp.]
MTNYILNDCKKSRFIVISLWLVYAASYFTRTCYAATIASIVSEGTFGKGQIGLVGTAFFICYGV